MPDVTAFLRGLRVGRCLSCHAAQVLAANDIAVAETFDGPDLSEDECAAAIVTAAHFYAAHRPNMRGTTHWENCWQVHPECAKKRAEELEAKLARWSPVIEAAKRTVLCQNRILDWADHERRRTGDNLVIWHIPDKIRDAYRAAFDDLVMAVDAALKEGGE
jgi:hypothetical protein